MRDAEMVALLQSGDKAGIETLLRQYTPLMRYIIAPLLPDARDQEECLADMAVKIWQNIGAFDFSKGAFTTWLTVLTRNEALNRARKKEPATQELPEDMPAPEADPEQIALRKEQQAALKQAIGQLSRAEQGLFYRKYYYRQSTAQIASELGTTHRAVEGRLYRIKQKLRAILGGEGFD